MKHPYAPFLFALVLFLLAIAVAHGQGPVTLTVTQVDTTHFPLVQVYVSATDAAGNPVRNLATSAFQLQENGRPLDITAATRAGEQGPVNTVLVIDRSGSMLRAGKIDGAKKAASAFVNLMRPDDRTALIQFDTQIDTLEPLTGDKPALLAAIQKITPRGDTAIYDALDQANQLLAPATGRKAVILVTDGLDNSSKISRDAVLKQAGDNGLSIYTVGLGNKASNANMEGIDESLLQSLASASNGTYAFTPDASQLGDLYQQLSSRIQNEYRLTYTSPSALHDGLRRNIVVTAAGAGQANVAYNPGGVIPEVASQSSFSSWLLFGVALVLLLGLFFAPVGVRLAQARVQARTAPQPKTRVKLDSPGAGPTLVKRSRAGGAGGPIVAAGTSGTPAPVQEAKSPVAGTSSPAASPRIRLIKKPAPGNDLDTRKMPWDEEGKQH